LFQKKSNNQQGDNNLEKYSILENKKDEKVQKVKPKVKYFKMNKRVSTLSKTRKGNDSKNKSTKYTGRKIKISNYRTTNSSRKNKSFNKEAGNRASQNAIITEKEKFKPKLGKFSTKNVANNFRIK
jgi:hypothetical protein